MTSLQFEFAGNTLQTWLIAVLIAAAIFVVLGVVRVVAARQFDKLSRHSDVAVWKILHAVIRRTKWLFIILMSLFAGSLAIQIPDKSRNIIHAIAVISLLIQAGLWVGRAFKVAVEQYRQQQLAKDPASVTMLNVLDFLGRVVVWIIVTLLVLDNLGVNITALVAGLGVGGIAIALAVQTILGDLLASLSIVLDKPFVVGDFLVVGELMGSVEHVGLKTTRLRSLSGEQLVFSNSDLLHSRIRNFGRMYERRVSFNIGVTYQTPREKLTQIPKIIREAIEQQSNTRFDRSHFKEYGDFALVFESVYYVMGPDYNTYMDIQQAINLYIHQHFEQQGIEFAYPTQTVFVNSQPANH